MTVTTFLFSLVGGRAFRLEEGQDGRMGATVGVPGRARGKGRAEECVRVRKGAKLIHADESNAWSGYAVAAKPPHATFWYCSLSLWIATVSCYGNPAGQQAAEETAAACADGQANTHCRPTALGRAREVTPCDAAAMMSTYDLDH